MVVMPVSGYLASNFSKYGIKYFNVVALPPWGVDDKQIYTVFNTTHIVTSYVFVGLIAIHAAAALTHLLRRDGIFERMWPGEPAKGAVGQPPSAIATATSPTPPARKQRPTSHGLPSVKRDHK